MRRVAWIGVFGAVLLFLNGCSSVSYVTDWDTQNDFSQYRTFAWYELAATPDRGTPPTAPNAIVADRIENAQLARCPVDARGAVHVHQVEVGLQRGKLFLLIHVDSFLCAMATDDMP